MVFPLVINVVVTLKVCIVVYCQDKLLILNLHNRHFILKKNVL